MSICSLGSQRRRIEFDILQRALCLPSGEAGQDAAEASILDAIQLGLLDARIDEMDGCVHIIRCAPRSFDSSQWSQLAARLLAWRAGVENVINELNEGGFARPVAANSSAGKVVDEMEAMESGVDGNPNTDFLANLETEAAADFEQ